METRTKICLCYVITALLITAFVYTLVITHFSSISKLERLQYEVDEITKVILGRKPDEALLPQIDSYVKKRTQGLWDELLAVKKSLESLEGSSSSSCGFCKKPPTDLQHVHTEGPNYALESVGASIASVEDEPYHPTNFLAGMFGIRHRSNFPARLLDPSMQPGHCYAFRGHKSVIIIKLSHIITIRAITVEHIPASASLTGDISNAPKEFRIYGLNELKSSEQVLLGSFEYNNTSVKRAQTFHMVNEKSYPYCKVEVLSNHGNANHTCIYRIAVHGVI